LIVIVAMKMEHVIRAPSSGTVEEILCTVGAPQLGSNRDIGMNETYVSCQYLHTLVEKVDQR
jgi:hypothetical protein